MPHKKKNHPFADEVVSLDTDSQCVPAVVFFICPTTLTYLFNTDHCHQMPTAVANRPTVVSDEVLFRSEYANPSSPRLLMGGESSTNSLQF